MALADAGGRPVVEYPCRWLFKVITLDQHGTTRSIGRLMEEEQYSISLSRTSSKGKYVCLNVEIEVDSQERRDSIYRLFKGLESVKVVL